MSLRQMAIGLALLILPSSAMANAYCEGRAARVMLTSAGELLVLATYRNDYTQICNVNQAWKGVAAQTCVMWYAAVNSSAVFGKKIRITYPGLQTACSALLLFGDTPPPGNLELFDVAG